jgi:hypothetical protein
VSNKTAPSQSKKTGDFCMTNDGNEEGSFNPFQTVGLDFFKQD